MNQGKSGPDAPRADELQKTRKLHNEKQNKRVGVKGRERKTERERGKEREKERKREGERERGRGRGGWLYNNA